MDDIPSLFGRTVEVFAYNHVQRRRTWETVMLTGLDGPHTDGTIRVVFTPRRCSEAFPGDFAVYWTANQIRRWVREWEAPIEENGEDELSKLIESVKEVERQYNETVSDAPITGFDPIKSILNTYAKPPQSLTATITTEDGHKYQGVVFLVEGQENDANNVH